MSLSREEIVQMKRVFSYLRDHAYTIRIKEDIDILGKDMDDFLADMDVEGSEKDDKRKN